MLKPYAVLFNRKGAKGMGGTMFMFLKQGVKVPFTITHEGSNFFHGFVRGLQEFCCFLEPLLNNVLVDGLSGKM